MRPNRNVAVLLFPHLEEPDFVVRERWVDAGHVITSAGVSAGIGKSLYLVGRLWSPGIARMVQLAMECFPDPPCGDVPLPEGMA